MTEIIDAADLPKLMRGMKRIRKPKVALRGAHVDYISVELPYPPTANNLTTVARGRKILGKAGRAYHKVVESACATLGHVEGKLYCEIHVYPPDRRRRDLMNAEKAILDGMVRAGIFADDSDIDEIRLSRREVYAGGKVLVVIWELDNEPFDV